MTSMKDIWFEPVIDSQNRQIAARNRAVKIQESQIDIFGTEFNPDAEPIVI